VRLRRLVEQWVIRGFAALLDLANGSRSRRLRRSEAVGTRERALEAFNAAVPRIPEVEECPMIASSFDYLLKVRTADVRRYRTVLDEKISSLPHVASTSTFVAMAPVKESGT
jgi:Lrp/AsnC family leucine-responsive transcriptional regulator